MGHHIKLQLPDVIILIADQFDEMEVITCYSCLRDKQLSVVFVSVMPGLVHSFRGISIHADSYLSQGQQLIAENKQQMILLAGGETCAAKALSDPRTHHLVQHILQRNGYVAVMAKTDFLVMETGLFSAEWETRIIRQGRGETAVFVNQLIEQFVAFNPH